MPLALYFDHNVPGPITAGLRRRGIDVLTAYEDRAHELKDPEILQRAGLLGRILFTMDEDFLAETAKLQAAETTFPGVVYVHPLRLSIGACIRDLEIIATAGTLEDLNSRVLILPL